MARQEQDREDLLREATALVERIELASPDHADPIVVGFRRGGDGSVYFGADPVYQFNSAGELRRGFLRGKLLKSVGGRLVAMQRQRTADAVSLVSEPLTADDQAAVLHECHERLATLLAQLRGGHFQIVGQVPPAVDLLGRAADWLARLVASPLTVAARANVGG